MDELPELIVAGRGDVGGNSFSAGTLVHTYRGLVPIEKIEIGDRVLSRPEKGRRELSYQPVVRTTASAGEQPLWRVSCVVLEGSQSQSGEFEIVLATSNHLFWVKADGRSKKGIGWNRTDELFQGAEIEVGSGLQALIESSNPLVKTKRPNVAWFDARGDEGFGFELVLKGDRVSHNYELKKPPHGFAKDGFVRYPKSVLFRRKVYNFDVANTHTYFVGKLGVWVQDGSS